MKKLIVVLLLPVIAFFGLLFSLAPPAAIPPPTTCTPRVPDWTGHTPADLSSWSKEAMGTAHTIYTTTKRLGFEDRAAIVAIATAIQESTLGTNPSTKKANKEGDAGLFQQRVVERDGALYGTLEQVNDPAWATETFLLGRDSPNPKLGHMPGLRDIKGWETMEPTRAAQAVQRSAYPSAYARHVPVAEAMLRTFSAPDSAGAAAVAQAPSMDCLPAAPQGLVCPSFNSPAEKGLTPDALRVLRCTKGKWPRLTSFGGIGDRPANVDDDHQTGRAVDLMIPDYKSEASIQLGTDIAEFWKANAGAFGVKYVIWRDRIWSVARDSEGWRPYGNPNGSDDTNAHRDHVHVSVYGDKGHDPEPPAGAPPGPGGPVSLPLAKGSYTITNKFGVCRSYYAACHTGLDFAGPMGANVLAVSDGTVISAGAGGAFGNLIKVQHAGFQSWYAHNASFLVSPGQQVRAGQPIALEGATGNARGAHSHLEIRPDGQGPIDPDRWLRERGVNP